MVSGIEIVPGAEMRESDMAANLSALADASNGALSSPVHGRLEPQALDAMFRLHEAGLALVAVTGRPLGWADVLVRLLPVRLAVGENGAGWVWLDSAVRREGYFASAAERDESARLLARIRDRVARDMPDVRVAQDQRARRCDLAFDIGETVQLAPDRIEQLTQLIEAEGARSAVSSVHAHAVPGDWDKAKGVRRGFAEVLGVDLAAERDRWLFVGDSGNDAEAFAWFPGSVGVANVAEHLDRLPIPPAFVTVRERGGGFAELADAVLAHREQGANS